MGRRLPRMLIVTWKSIVLSRRRGTSSFNSDLRVYIQNLQRPLTQKSSNWTRRSVWTCRRYFNIATMKL